MCVCMLANLQQKPTRTYQLSLSLFPSLFFVGCSVNELNYPEIRSSLGLPISVVVVGFFLHHGF